MCICLQFDRCQEATRFFVSRVLRAGQPTLVKEELRVGPSSYAKDPGIMVHRLHRLIPIRLWRRRSVELTKFDRILERQSARRSSKPVTICVDLRKSVDSFDSVWIDHQVATYSAGGLDGNAQNYQRFARLEEVAAAVVVLASPARFPTLQGRSSMIMKPLVFLPSPFDTRW